AVLLLCVWQFFSAAIMATAILYAGLCYGCPAGDGVYAVFCCYLIHGAGAGRLVRRSLRWPRRELERVLGLYCVPVFFKLPAYHPDYSWPGKRRTAGNWPECVVVYLTDFYYRRGAGLWPRQCV